MIVQEYSVISMRKYYVYILLCADGSYYTGITSDYEARLDSHQRGDDPKSYTFKRRPVKIVYLSDFSDIHDAISWEKHVKRWSRNKKEALIRGEWEKLPELSECQNETHYRNYKRSS